MSAVPSRTRSLRKPAAESSQYERSTATIPAETQRERGNVSPSRLPKPPSSSASLPRPTNISRPLTSASTGTASIRPQRTGVSRPPLTSDNKTASLRSGARTPTESNTSLQRAPSTRHSRNSSTSALPSRPPSSSGSKLFPSTASTLIRPPSSASTTITTAHHDDHKPSSNINSVPSVRPAFSTLQQHFSPARSLAPKPPTASFLAPPSPSKLPAAIAASAEVSRLQAELLQLHLLHQSASPVLAQYRASAKRNLRSRWEDVGKRHRELVELEAVEGEKGVARCLKAWDQDGGQRSGFGLDEKVQILDQVLSGAWKISEPGGRYVRMVKKFERWLNGVWDILESRKQSSNQIASSNEDGDWDGSEEMQFIEELDDEWRDEREFLGRKLEGWREQLVLLGAGLGEGSRTSSFEAVVKGVRELVNGMCEEVGVMERVVRGVMEMEEGWRRRMIEEDDGDEEEGGRVEGRAVGGAWRSST